MAVKQWEISDKARESVQPYVDHLERTCPEMLAVQMRRLVALAKVHLPPMATAQAAFLVRCPCGFGMPFAETVLPFRKIDETGSPIKGDPSSNIPVPPSAPGLQQMENVSAPIEEAP